MNNWNKKNYSWLDQKIKLDNAHKKLIISQEKVNK